MKFLDKCRPHIFAVSRMIFGFMFAMHGLKNALGLFGGPPDEMPVVAGVFVGGIEIVCGTMVAVGFKTRAAAFFSSGMMAVAYFAVHQPTGLLPIQTHGELAALYAWIFLMIAAVGDWKWAVDSTSDTAKSQPQTQS